MTIIDRAKIDGWRAEVRVYRSECVRLRDFARLMRVRLSQSKVGRWVAPRPIVVDVDLATLGPSVRLRSHTTDISVLKELLVGGNYAWLPADLDVATIVDLGANVGLSHRWLRARYPHARFVCVEPDAGNLAILRANVRAVDRDATILAACVGGSPRWVRMATTTGEWGFRITDAAGEGETEVITMEDLLATAGFDHVSILKCDIEGAEAELFADCRSWIGKVDAMSVECHLDKMTTETLFGTLEENGGHFAVCHHESNPHLGFDVVTLERATA